ncbi:hypothetical protein [Pseudoxanthomonas putridarboris]|uniref:Uncharacterized protein n=1 Tax=Pseudoxanthomonas putridarboris TaxID=752605 RepID=A0ABU9IXA1_9GAMM
MQAAVLGWLTSLLASTGSPGAELVGRVVPPYPDGLQDVGGSCVSDSSDPLRVCEYAITLLASAPVDAPGEPEPRYLIAGRMAGREGAHARWQVTDAVPYPDAVPGYYLQFGTCRLDGQDDSRVAAIVRQHGMQEWLKDIAWAGRIELPAGRFTVLDAKAVDCINEAYYGL